MSESRPAPEPVFAHGLCPACTHVREIQSAKGTVFLLCGMAATDPRYGRYPPQPVRACPGYRPRGRDT